MFIDLHGLTESEALLELDGALLTFDDSYEDTIEIITGNGIVLKGVVIEEVSKYGYAWRHPHGNSGSIIVYKK